MDQGRSLLVTQQHASDLSRVHDALRRLSCGRATIREQPQGVVAIRAELNMISSYRYRLQPDVAVEDAHGVAQGDGTDWSARADMVRGIKQIVLRGDVRRISIEDAYGRTLIEVPHLLGSLAGPRMDPIWAAVDALARAAGRLTIHVDREESWPVQVGATVTRAATSSRDRRDESVN